MSKPIAATAGSRSMAVRKVPDLVTPVFGSLTAPSERGKSSYQLLNSARSRSTHSGIRSLAVTKSRSGCSARIATTSVESATASRASTGRDVSRSATAASSSVLRPTGDRVARAARSRTTAPSSSISSTSTPAGILIVAA